MQKMWHHEKDTCLQHENKKRAENCLVLPSAGNVWIEQPKFFFTPQMSMSDYRSAMSTDFGFMNKFLWVGESTKTESVSNEDKLICLYSDK